MNRIFIPIIFTLILVSSLVYLNLKHYIDAPSKQTKEANFIIPRGYSVKKIGKELHSHGLVDHAKIFWLLHKIFYSDYPLQAGEYRIPAHSSIGSIIEMMHEGRVIIHKFTIPEGTTTQEILNKVDEEKMLIGNVTRDFNDGDFISDTYHYTYGETKMMFLNRIYKKSQILLDQLWSQRVPNLPLSNKHEAIVLASIIEKETSLARERKRIAGVFINRLNKGMRLQADPTVIYAITQGKYPLKRSITKADLRIKSLYNTYLYAGLPPTAISNPGKDALEAVLNPLKTTELYFVVNITGGHNFASSLSQHNKNVNNYRKYLKNRKRKKYAK